MSMKLQQRSVFDRAGGRSGLMMTPMVDVVLVILIFFMASTTIVGYEWFLQASVEAPAQSLEPADHEEARFELPSAVIDLDLVRTQDGNTLVYGLSGETSLQLERAIEMIGTIELNAGGDLKTGLTVGLGAGDLVPMGDVMALHDAWNNRGVGVVMRTTR